MSAESTAKAIREGMFAFIRPVMTSAEGRCVATTRCRPEARAQLGDADYALLHVLGGDQHEIGQLVYQYHYARQRLAALGFGHDPVVAVEVADVRLGYELVPLYIS
jgi:hypothetical protein